MASDIFSPKKTTSELATRDTVPGKLKQKKFHAGQPKEKFRSFALLDGKKSNQLKHSAVIVFHLIYPVIHFNQVAAI